MKDLFGRKNWIILILFGLVGQLAWSVENMYFNVFLYNMFHAGPGAIAAAFFAKT